MTTIPMKYFLQRCTKIAVIVAIYAIAIVVSLRQPAKSQVIDSSFYKWTVYELQANELEDKKCYIVTHPIDSDSNHVGRDKPYIMITRFQQDRVEEVSIFGGFEYKINSNIFILIDDLQHHLTAKKDLAWADTRSDDIRIIQSLLRGAKLKVRSNSALGTYAIDEYSLKGITRAYNRMKEICR